MEMPPDETVLRPEKIGKGRKEKARKTPQCTAHCCGAEDQEHMGGDYCAERDGATGWEEEGNGADRVNKDAKPVKYYKQGGKQAWARDLEEEKAAFEPERDCFK